MSMRCVNYLHKKMGDKLWTEAPGGLQSIWRHKESNMTEQLTLSFTFTEENG